MLVSYCHAVLKHKKKHFKLRFGGRAGTQDMSCYGACTYILENMVMYVVLAARSLLLVLIT